VQTWRVDDWPVGERRDAWADAIGRTHLDWGLDGRDGLVVAGASVSRRELGDVALVDCVAGPGSGARARRRIAATDGAYVGLLLVRSGREDLEFGPERMVVRAGDAVLWDSRLPTRFRVPDLLVKRTLLVPLGRLPDLAERPLAGTRLAPTMATALLLAHLDTVAALPGDLPPATARAAGSAAVELLAAALTGEGTDGAGWSTAAARWREVLAYAEARLGDPALDPRALAAACGISLRALYTLFEQHGETVAGFLRRRRLARAHAELVRLGRATTVAAVGRQWGFPDADSFARAYRRQFGRPPSRTLGSRRG
jgi:AraC-like DNA-binding protein